MKITAFTPRILHRTPTRAQTTAPLDTVQLSGGNRKPALAKQAMAVAAIVALAAVLLPHPPVVNQMADITLTAGPVATVQLAQLASSGVLQSKDQNGDTTLSHLHQLAHEPIAQGIDRAQAMRELMANLAQPGEIRQNNRGTCAITSIEYIHDKTHPADYARVVTGLLSKNGTTNLANGECIERNASGTLADDSQRTSVDRVYQSSLSGFASAPEGYIYNNNQTGGGAHIYSDGTVAHSGTTGAETVRALRATLNQPYSCHTEPGHCDADLQTSLQEGRQPEVFLIWAPNPSDTHRLHALVVEKVESDKVLLRNPWGAWDTGSSKDGPPRQIVNSKTGLISLDKAEFYNRLNAVLD